MKYAIKILTSERNSVISELKKQNEDKANLLENLKSIDRALKWLRILDENYAGSAGDYELIKLPFMQNCFESYRVMSDCESENIGDWEYRGIEIFPDDIILTKNKGVKK